VIWEKKNRLSFTSNAEQSLSEFYIQISEENINIVLSQIRVSETNLKHNLLINNKERKQYVKQENNKLHQETLHHIIMTQESGNKMPLYSSKSHLQPVESSLQ
jgi:hypothetical protein